MIATQRTTTKAPLTATTEGVGDQNWQNPTNILTDNATSAFWGAAGGGESSNILVAKNFQMAIPSNAVIKGVVVTVDGSSFSAYNSVNLQKNGVIGADRGNFANLQPTYGSPTDMWALTLTPTDVNHTEFGVRFFAGDVSGGDANASIDYVTITVYWEFNVDVAPAEVPVRYDHKIYSPTGQYIGNIAKQVISEFETRQDINTAGSQLTFEVAGTMDTPQPIAAPGRLLQWLPGGWDYRTRMLVPKYNLTGAVTDMPTYVNLAHMPSHFWNKVKSDGGDIRITDAYGIVEVPFELIGFNKTTKVGILWFRAPLLTNEYDNHFFFYYGNASASAYSASSTYGSQNVWAGYSGSWHLGDGSTLSLADSTSNARTLTNTGITAGTGKISGGAVIDATGDMFQTPDIPLAGGKYTISTWFEWPLTTAGGTWWTLTRGSTADHHVIVERSTGLLGVYTGAFNSSGYNMYNLSTGWHRLIATTSGTTTKFYIDGVLVGTSAVRSTADLDYIGNYQAGGQPWGNIDEFSVTLTGDRSLAWAKAEYANQNNPSTFYSFEPFQSEDTEGYTALLRNGNLINVYESSYYYPNGKLMYQGQINRIEAKYDPDISSVIRVLCHSDGRDLDNMVARGSPFTYTSDQSQTTGASRVSVINHEFGGWENWGQRWTANATSLGRIQLLMDGTATVTVRVYSNPQLTTFLGSVTKSVSVAGPTVVSFEFADIIPTVVGEDYFVWVSVNSGQSIWLHYNDNGNLYANGAMYHSSYSGGSGGGSFVEQTNDDLYFTTASGTPSTQATYTSKDPTTLMLKPIIDDYRARGGAIRYDDVLQTVDATGLSLTISFNTNTILEAMKKILDMSPSGFYFYVDLGTNILYFKDTSRTADFILVKGKHIGGLDLAFSIENVVNDLLFSGGEVAGSNLYAEYTDPTSRTMYGQRLDRKSDNRVTLLPTADAIGTSRIAERKDEQHHTILSVPARTMDITLLRPGKTVGFRGFGNFVDNLLLQITKVDYNARRAVMQVGTLPVEFNTSIEQITRGLLQEQTVKNPSTPS